MNIIEQYQKSNKELDSTDLEVYEVTCRNRNEISTKEFLNIIAETNEFHHKGDKLNDLLVSYGNISIFFQNNAEDLHVDFAAIPIYEDKGIRLIIEYRKIIERCCEAMVSPYIKEKFIIDNFEELDSIFSNMFTRIYEKKMVSIYNRGLEKFLGETHQNDIKSDKDALLFAQILKKEIMHEFGEDFTEGLFTMMTFELSIKIRKLFFKYLKENFENEESESDKKTEDLSIEEQLKQLGIKLN